MRTELVEKTEKKTFLLRFVTERCRWNNRHRSRIEKVFDRHQSGSRNRRRPQQPPSRGRGEVRLPSGSCRETGAVRSGPETQRRIRNGKEEGLWREEAKHSSPKLTNGQKVDDLLQTFHRPTIQRRLKDSLHS